MIAFDNIIDAITNFNNSYLFIRRKTKCMCLGKYIIFDR